VRLVPCINLSISCYYGDHAMMRIKPYFLISGSPGEYTEKKKDIEKESLSSFLVS
jgi:hypothetical protein